MTIVRMSPFAAALRSANMLRELWPLADQRESARSEGASVARRRTQTAKSVNAHAACSGDRSRDLRDWRESDMALEADLHAVFLDDGCGKIFPRLGIAHGDGVALRAVFHREAFHRDDQRAIDGGDFNKVAFLHERTTGDVTPGEHPAGWNRTGKNKRTIADGRWQRIALAEQIDAAR